MSAGSKKRWITRNILKELFAYPFSIGCQLVVVRVDPENEPLIDQFRRLSFNEYRIPRMRGIDKEEVVMTLTKEDWAKHPVNAEGKRHG